MANFAVTNSTTPAGIAQVNTGSSYTVMLAWGNSTNNANFVQPGSLVGGNRRTKLYDILVGTNATPADNYIEYECARVTLVTTLGWTGSVSSVSSQYTLDSADVGFCSFVTMNGSAGSSQWAVRLSQAWYVGVNQRASYRWVAAPGSEIVTPAISSGVAPANNGLALQNRSGAYTGTVTGTVMVSEQ